MSSKRKGLITHDAMPWSKGRFYQDLPGFLQKLGAGVKEWWRVSGLVSDVSWYAKQIKYYYDKSQWRNLIEYIEKCQKCLDELKKTANEMAQKAA